MSSPSYAQSPLKLRLNMTNPPAHATLPTSLKRSPDADYLNAAQSAKTIISPAKLTNLLNPSVDSSPSPQERDFQHPIASPTPLSNSPNEATNIIELHQPSDNNNTVDLPTTSPKPIPYQPRLLKVARKKLVTFSSDPTSPVSQVTVSTTTPSTPTQIQLAKKLYPPKRKLRGTKRSILHSPSLQKVSDPEHIPSRKIEIRSQPVFGIRGTMAWKAKYHKKSRRKGPQPLFKKVLVKNANMVVLHRIIAQKDLKPRKWKLESIIPKDGENQRNVTYTWKPTSNRMIQASFILPPAPVIHRKTNLSKSAQPHTIPAPKALTMPKPTTNDKGMIPVVTFIDGNGNKRLQCPGKDCPKHFADRCGLNRHKNRHHPEIGPLGAQLPPIQSSS